MLVAALVILTLIGMWAARGAVRLGIFLFGLTGLLLYLVPVAVLSYELRYGIPPLLLITVSGTLGFAALVARRNPGAVLVGEKTPSENSPPGEAEKRELSLGDAGERSRRVAAR